jgi:FkbM family methyltransferase
MPLLNRVRLLTNKLLAPAGLAVERVDSSDVWGSPMVTAQVGRYSIRLPRSNPVSMIYVTHPEYNSQLSALVTLLQAKYPKMSAIDIGANAGDTACIIKSAADIPLVCIEGDDNVFQFLQDNIRQFQNVTAHKMFLGEQTGTIAATFEKAGWNTTIKPGESSAAQTIRIMSLDDFLAGQPVAGGCKLIKIDAEGFDCSIIRGAAKFLQQTRPVITFEYNRDNMEAIGEKGWETLAMLRGLGYSQVAFHDNNGRFFTAADFANDGLIRDMLDYADGKRSEIYYFDLTVFHQDDADIAKNFVNDERTARLKTLGSPK